MVTFHKRAGLALNPEAAKKEMTMDKVLQYLNDLGEPQPNALLSIAFTIEEDDKIRGLSMVQSLPFIEPFYAENGYGQYLATLYGMTKEFIIGSQAKRFITHSSRCDIAEKIKREPGVIVMTDEFYDWRR